jgi:glycosyltransferase involved in cell wall biosynthesis
MAYNERETVADTVRELLAVLEPRDELLIVDDGSTDGTQEISEQLAVEDRRITVHRHAANSGLGAVYRTGFRAASTDLLTFFPADGQFPATIVRQFREAIADKDLILGYLTTSPSVLSTVERLLYRRLFGPMPQFQGVMMLRVERLRTLAFASFGRDWTIVMELILRAQRAGWRIESMETAYRPRRYGRSKVQNIRTVLAHLRQLIALRRVLC